MNLFVVIIIEYRAKRHRDSLQCKTNILLQSMHKALYEFQFINFKLKSIFF